MDEQNEQNEQQMQEARQRGEERTNLGELHAKQEAEARARATEERAADHEARQSSGPQEHYPRGIGDDQDEESGTDQSSDEPESDQEPHGAEVQEEFQQRTSPDEGSVA